MKLLTDRGQSALIKLNRANFESKMWFNSHIYFSYFLTIFKIHHQEIVDNGLVMYNQDRESCNIVLQTTSNTFICHWKLNEKSVFDYHAPVIDATYMYYNDFRKKGFEDTYLSGKLDILKFAKYPRQYMYWLEKVATESHGIFDVFCEIETEKVNLNKEDASQVSFVSLG